MKKILLGLALSLFFIIPVQAAEFNVNLKYGSKGSEVKKLQEFLVEQNLYTGPITGNFFSLTLKAVKSFQTRESIAPVSGFFGVLTRTKANQILDEQLVETESEAVNEPLVIEPVSSLNDVVAGLQSQIGVTNQQLSAIQGQNQILQNSLSLQQSEADRLRAAADAEAARVRAIEQARLDAENLERQQAEAEARKPLYTQDEMLVKFGGTPGDTATNLLYVRATPTTVQFNRSGSAVQWGDAKVVFNGQTVLTLNGGGFSMPDGTFYDCTVSYCIYPPGRISGLTPQTTYTYQIVLPTPGRDDSVLNGSFYTPGGDQTFNFNVRGGRW